MNKDLRICETISAIETYGTNTVTTEDLLTIILDNRAKAKKLLNQEKNLFQDGILDGLKGILKQDYDGLKYLGLTPKEACKILAAIEIGIRSARIENKEPEHITNPGDAAQYFISRLKNEHHEKFYVMLLNTKNRILKTKQISEGSLTSSIVHPREAYAPAVANHAACVLAVHNHPSGDPYPSTEDRNLTKALKDAGEILGIPLMDHIIIGDGRYYSFKEHGEF